MGNDRYSLKLQGTYEIYMEKRQRSGKFIGKDDAKHWCPRQSRRILISGVTNILYIAQFERKVKENAKMDVIFIFRRSCLLHNFNESSKCDRGNDGY